MRVPATSAPLRRSPIDAGARVQPGASQLASSEQVSKRPPSSELGEGQALDTPLLAFFEPRFGADLGGVRVHVGASAERSAAAVRAHAYTVGQHIVFGRGQYQPNSPRGRWLLAHELTHVVQQSSVHPRRHAESPTIRHADAVPTLRRVVSYQDDCHGLFGPCDSRRDRDRERLLLQAEAIRRLEQTAPWGALSRELDRLLPSGTIFRRFCARQDRCPSDGLPPCPAVSEPLGKFCPDHAGASTYAAFVYMSAHGSLDAPPVPEGGDPISSDVYGSEVIPSYVVQEPSRVAETLFHELLHIWYVNRFPARLRSELQNTGHEQGGPAGHMETAFADRLRAFAREIHRVERDAIEQARQQPPSPSEAQPADPLPDVPRPSTAVPTTRDPSELSFLVGVGVGGGLRPELPDVAEGTFGASFVAGLVYGRAYQFRAVGSLLWIPEVGLISVGGELGVRLLQTEGEFFGGSDVASNPMFLDLSVGAGGVIELQDDALSDPSIVPVLISAGLDIGGLIGDPTGVQGFLQGGVRAQAMPTTADESVLFGVLGQFSGGVQF